MNLAKIWRFALVTAQLGLAFLVSAQPILIQPGLAPGSQSNIGSGFTNLRVTRQSADGTEATLTMDYTYDGRSGPTVRIVPIIVDRKQPDASKWFGADPATMGQGRGTVSVKVKFFNDEPGVPPRMTTDHVRVLMLNSGGAAVITQGQFANTISWGSASAVPTPPVQVAVIHTPAVDLAEQKRLADERAKAEAAAAEATRQAEIARKAEAARQAEEARLAEQRRVADEKAKQEAAAAEAARQAEIARKAETARQAEIARQAEQKQLADEKAKADAVAAEAVRQAELARQAEVSRQAEETRLAEQRRVAEEKVKQEAAVAETARQAEIARKAEAARQAEIARQAEEKRLADERAKAESVAAEASRQAEIARKAEETRKAQEAEAVEQKHLADERAKADAAAAEAKHQVELARQAEEARKAEQTRQAELKRIADEKAQQEAAVAEAARQAEIARNAAEARKAEEARLAEQKHLADERAKAEIAAAEAKHQAELARQAEEARKAEEARQTELKRIAEEKAQQEAAVAEAARQAEIARKAEETRKAEEARLTEQKRLADERAKAEAAAAEASRKADEARLAAAKASFTPAHATTFAIANNMRSKVSNVDVVNRSMDRTEMTIGVEYQYDRDDKLGSLGVDLSSSDDPAVAGSFTSTPVQIDKGSRDFALIPVKFHPMGDAMQRSTTATDKLWVYLTDGAGHKSYLFQATMALSWKNPSAVASSAAPVSHNNVQMEFKQNNAFGGYVTVKYFLDGPVGRLRLRIYDSSNPSSSKWFESEDVDVKTGEGFQLVKIAVSRDANSPDLFKADTLHLQLLDKKDKELATQTQRLDMSWAKPKE